ncbi:hypothetical protein Taro_003405, partial [Colocasia esculenta]|nr:hypothetical protein [Colocasia esculenta]
PLDLTSNGPYLIYKYTYLKPYPTSLSPKSHWHDLIRNPLHPWTPPASSPRHGSPSVAGKVDGTVTALGAVVEDWLRHVQHIHRCCLNSLVVGLDVEWRPNFGCGVDNPSAILQLCILYADYVPDRLADFLEDEQFTFVGVGVDEDANNLDRHWGLAVGRTRDLRHLVAEASHLPEMRGCGLAWLVEEDSNVTLSRSDQRWLSREQIMYAVTDDFLSFEIGWRVIVDDYPLFSVNI